MAAPMHGGMAVSNLLLAALLAAPPMGAGLAETGDAAVSRRRAAEGPRRVRVAAPPPTTSGISLGRRAPASQSSGATTHGVHLRSGISIVPSFILGQFFETHGNALCRSELGSNSVAAASGANTVGGCNFYIEGGYRLKRRRFALQASVGYTRLFMPDSLWLGKGEPLEAADYTQIRLHVATGQLDFIGEVPVARKFTNRLTWRFGGSIGLGLLFGGVYRTKLGSQRDACTMGTVGNLQKCSPYRAQEFDEPWRETPGFATCTKDGCSEADLIRAGREEDPLPSVIPVGRLFTGPRLQATDALGITAEAGLGLGFTFGLSVDASF